MARITAHARASVASQRPGPVPDDTDRVIHQWAKVRPDLNVSPIGVVARLERLRAILAEEQEAVFAEYGISNPAFTTLVTLVRINQPGGVSQRRLAMYTTRRQPCGWALSVRVISAATSPVSSRALVTT